MIVWSIVFFDANTPHPSLFTLVPVGGTALIISFTSKEELVGKVLGCKPFVLIGLISYSAYLWHFPIMSLVRISNGSHTITLKWLALIFILTLVLSAITYHFVERPFEPSSDFNL